MKNTLTVEEIAKKVLRDGFCMTNTEANANYKPIEKALLTFAAQEAEPLVEAGAEWDEMLNRHDEEIENAEKQGRSFTTSYIVGAIKARQRFVQALTAHRAKYPRKP